jgi:hypothetical protein
MKKTITLTLMIIVMVITIVIVPWSCRRRMHYNFAYKGKVNKQIEKSEVIKDLEDRISALEKNFSK